MDYVKAGEVVRQGVGLMKFKRVVLLRFYVHSDNFKACPMISRRRAARATVEVK